MVTEAAAGVVVKIQHPEQTSIFLSVLESCAVMGNTGVTAVIPRKRGRNDGNTTWIGFLGVGIPRGWSLLTAVTACCYEYLYVAKFGCTNRTILLRESYKRKLFTFLS